MSTLPLRVSHVPAFPGLARLVATLVMLMDAFVEAQDVARAAHKRLPFVDW